MVFAHWPSTDTRDRATNGGNLGVLWYSLIGPYKTPGIGPQIGVTLIGLQQTPGIGPQMEVTLAFYGIRSLAFSRHQG